MSEALYNKYRPQVFEDVVGQEHIERTLKNAIASDKISHAYLFTGPRGTGKTTTARLLSKALLCDAGQTPEPDGSCEDCNLIARGEHPDVYELDAASRTGVENVREEIIGKVNYAPTRGRYKIYIIDEVHMLSTAAFNALLKTLEEPPSHVVFVLCTTDPQKVPETILSRCQRFDFRRISNEELVSRLGAICELENVPFDGDALELIAHRAQGGMRDALTSLEQMIAFGNGEITMEMAERMLGSVDSSELSDIVLAIGKRDAATCFRWTSEYMETGADLVQFSSDLTKHMRDMYIMSLAEDSTALELSESQRRELEAESEWFGPDRISRMLGVLGDLLGELKTSTNQRLSFEVALTKLIRPESDVTIEALTERVETLERMISNLGSSAVATNGPTLHDATPASEPSQTIAADSSAHGETINPAYELDGGNGSDDVLVAEPMEAASEAEPREPDMSVPAGSSPLDIAKIWRSVMAYMKKKPGVYSTLFMEVKVFDDDGKIFISFSPKNNIVFRAANKPEARAVLEEALSAAGATGIAYELVQGRGFGDESNSAIQPAVEEEERKTPASDAQDEPSGSEMQAEDEADDIAKLISTAFGEGAVIEEID